MNIDLKKIRAENGRLTQSELADRLGVKLRTIQNYENGTPIPISMEKLIVYEFKLENGEEEQTQHQKNDVYQLIEEISSKLSAKDAHILDAIKEEYTKQEQETEAYREKYYKTLERLDKLKTYMIKSLKIPAKYLD